MFRKGRENSNTRLLVVRLWLENLLRASQSHWVAVQARGEDVTGPSLKVLILPLSSQYNRSCERGLMLLQSVIAEAACHVEQIAGAGRSLTTWLISISTREAVELKQLVSGSESLYLGLAALLDVVVALQAL